MENELVEAKNKAAAASSAENSAMDLTNVFVEAQRTASTIVTQAKENARKMDEDAKKLANQVVDDEDYKDVAYFEPFYLKEFVASMPKKLL